MNKNNISIIYISLTTLIIGILIGWQFIGNKPDIIDKNQQENMLHNNTWTCSMHPQIRKQESGSCPLCGMDLIPLGNESNMEDNLTEIKMSKRAMKLANVQTWIVTKRKPTRELRLNGTVKADERNVFSQSSHIPGRIEKLFVSFTGQKVRKGQVLAHIYSPELVTAQRELFESWKMREEQPSLYEATRGKLINWKLSEKQIDDIIESEEIQEHFPVLAEESGVVQSKIVNLGDYVKKGIILYKIVNLDKIWVLFNVYEDDIPWVKLGNQISFSVNSFPEKAFTGYITFIDPVINPRTRVTTARVEINNKEMKLKPDMFVLGVMKSQLKNQNEVIVVPKSAVMWTGERSVLYVKNPSEKRISFNMRTVTIGSTYGNSYIIKNGIIEGEEIAVNGAFSIDAAGQLAGKPSMMNSDGIYSEKQDLLKGKQAIIPKYSSENTLVLSKIKVELKPILYNYLMIKDALVKDNYQLSKQASMILSQVISRVNKGNFKGEYFDGWNRFDSGMSKALKAANTTKNITEFRNEFKNISAELIKIVQIFGKIDQALLIDYCPMADNYKGAYWISTKKEIENPYFGKSMLRCGVIKQEIK